MVDEVTVPQQSDPEFWRLLNVYIEQQRLLIQAEKEREQAERDKEQAEREAAQEARRLQQIERRRERWSEELHAKASLLMEQVEGQYKLLQELLTQFPLSSAVAELIEVQQAGFDQLSEQIYGLILFNRALLLMLAQRGQIQEVKELTGLLDGLEMEAAAEPHIGSLKRRLLRLNRRRDLLNEQAALYGGITNAPSELRQQVEETEQAIQQVQWELQ